MNESAKSLRLERIKAEAARDYLDRRHPLGAGANFSVGLGVFLDGRLEGVLTLGGPTSNLAGRALGLEQHELLEVRKMHLTDRCPRNSESRALAIMARLVRRHYPGLKALITYCDTAETASAYRAAGWREGKSHRYVREVKVAGRWFSVRNANRKGIMDRASEKRFETRCKWVLPLAAEVAALV